MFGDAEHHEIAEGNHAGDSLAAFVEKSVGGLKCFDDGTRSLQHGGEPLQANGRSAARVASMPDLDRSRGCRAAQRLRKLAAGAARCAH